MMKAGTLALKPANITYEEEAAIPFGGNTVLHFLSLRFRYSLMK
jgi:NADPH:quinone reductase-like Zn-dependent oxidoreductase